MKKSRKRVLQQEQMGTACESQYPRMCGSCNAYEPPSIPGILGECRAEYPQMDKEGRGVWPMTHEKDWCGEWVLHGAFASMQPVDVMGMIGDDIEAKEEF